MGCAIELCGVLNQEANERESTQVRYVKVSRCPFILGGVINWVLGYTCA